MYRIKNQRLTRKKSKYRNQSIMYNGSRYDSHKEARYAEDLDWRIKAGEIKSYDRQVKISLDVNGKHIANYYIDFVVHHNDGSREYVEVKGFCTRDFLLKWKLFEALLPEIDPGMEMTIIR